MNNKTMKKKTIVVLLTMAVGLLAPLPMKAQYDGLLNLGLDATDGGFTHQSFGNTLEVDFTHQSFGNGLEVDFTHQSFGNDVGGGFTHQPFGNDAPLGGGLLILLSAGASYAALKRTRQNNKQQ